MTTVLAAIEPHLHEFCQVGGVAEQPGIACHSAHHACHLVVNIAFEQLAAQKTIVFGGYHFIYIGPLERTIAGAIGAKWRKNVFLHIFIVFFAGYALLGIEQQTEIETAIAKILVIAQFCPVYSLHYGVARRFAHIHAIGGFDVESLLTLCFHKVGAQAGFSVAVSAIVEFYGVVAAASTSYKASSITSVVEHQRRHNERRRHTGFMKKKIFYCKIFFISVLEWSYIFAYFIVEVEASVVVAFHQSRQGAGGFGHRCEVEDGVIVYRAPGLAVVGVSVIAIAYHLTMSCHKHLQTGEGFESKCFARHYIHLAEHLRVHSHFFGHGIPESYLAVFRSCACLGKAGYAHREFSVHVDAAKYGLRCIVLCHIGVFVCHQHRLAVLERTGKSG